MQKSTTLIRQSLIGIYPEEEIRAISRLIWEEVCGYTPVEVILHKDTILDENTGKKIASIVTRLTQGEPIQHILGFAHFDGHKFTVTRDTLIPRPETAELVALIARESPTGRRVADIGTGSGCIAISLAHRHPEWHVEGWDISEKALVIARQNNRDIGTNVSFIPCDILSFTPSPHDIGSYDIIVSNPPYIVPSEKCTMARNVLEYEPHSALFVPEEEPLLFYKSIADCALGLLHRDGRLYFEINPLFAQETVSMLDDYGYTDITLHRDFCDRQRFISATR